MFLLTVLVRPAAADDAHIAVAANFADAARDIGRLFSDQTRHRAVFSFASTGTLYTQISQGAPFDAFLAADHERPQKAVHEGLAVSGSEFTYAIGKIALYSRNPDLVSGPEILTLRQFDRIALANPVTAPYGAAAVQAMRKMEVLDALSPNFVYGNNIAQTFQFVETGNAELGFVAQSQLVNRTGGSMWEVPQDLYQPIRQDAVLLKHGSGNPAAEAFLHLLKSAAVRTVLAKYGYGSSE
ncbi:MAG: molybdate ABC transporter substrate-binding protein [Rhodospirillales bacterium]|nr:molybdate ABC transporter substrate-binding protein [Rhodospirillales bacterium]MBO6788881.1 molybdate ABC transporter substrate-binding protein [Rhodospirillales bacterium]